MPDARPRHPSPASVPDRRTPGTDTKQRGHPPTGGWPLSSDMRQSAAVCAVVSGRSISRSRSMQPALISGRRARLSTPVPASGGCSGRSISRSGPCFRPLSPYTVPGRQPPPPLPAVISKGCADTCPRQSSVRCWPSAPACPPCRSRRATAPCCAAPAAKPSPRR